MDELDQISSLRALAIKMAAFTYVTATEKSRYNMLDKVCTSIGQHFEMIAQLDINKIDVNDQAALYGMLQNTNAELEATISALIKKEK